MMMITFGAPAGRRRGACAGWYGVWERQHLLRGRRHRRREDGGQRDTERTRQFRKHALYLHCDHRCPLGYVRIG